MDTSDIDYSLANRRLVKLLQSVDRPGNYCVGDRLFVPMPRVTVDQVGVLSFPVPQAQIDALIQAAERAPYGKGTQTLTDTSVRDCWQIDAKQVSVGGRGWMDTLTKIMDQVSRDFGLADGKLYAELYKLLVYREGGFFAAHRDTEKVSGMIATLSLSLPTPGEGGELVVSHGGDTTTFDMSAQDPSELAFAAFYADCLHEARPVTKGHRISLVFNLFVRSGQQWTGAPNYANLTEKVANCLRDWRQQGKTEKLAWLLDHGYSEEGLSFDTLKGTDAAVAQVLREAAKHADCSMHAAILHISEVGEPELDFTYDHWGNEEPISGDTLAHVEEREIYLETWIAPDGSRPKFGILAVKSGEIHPPEALEGADPDEELLEEYQGNYGPTLELIYRFAALVIWPAAHTVKIVARGGIENAVSWVEGQCERKDPASVRRMLADLVKAWPKETYGSKGDDARATMLRLLDATGNTNLTARFLDGTMLKQYCGSENRSLAELVCKLGPEMAENFMQLLVERYLPKHPKELLALLTLVAKYPDKAGPQWRDMEEAMVRTAISGLPASLEAAAKALDALMPRRDRNGHRHYGSKETFKHLSLDAKAVCNLFVLAGRLGLVEESVQAAQIIAEFPKIVTPDRILPAALEGLYKTRDLSGTRAYRMLWRQAADFLLERSSVPPGEPDNWQIEVDLPCDSELCIELQAFCRHHTARVRRFKVAKDSRRYLHQLIEDHELDLDHVTERKGSPYTLVCTKNRNSYERRLKEYTEDVQCIGLLSSIVPANELGGMEAERMQQLESAHAASIGQ